MRHRATTAILVLTAAAGAHAVTPRLVADLESHVPGRPAFTGRAWSTDRGVVVLGDDTLWLLDPGGSHPTPLLRGTSWPWIHDLGDGELVARGTSLSGEDGTWITDGGPPRLLAPSWWQPWFLVWEGSIARYGDGFGAKAPLADGEGYWLWQLTEDAAPQPIEPGGVVFHDPTWLECLTVVSAPEGIITCSAMDDPPGLRFGSGATTSPAPRWPYEAHARGIQLAGARYFPAAAQQLQRWDLLRSDGTAEGTAVAVEGVIHSPVPIWGGAAAVRHLGGDQWEILTFDGVHPPGSLTILSIPGFLTAIVPAADWLYLVSRTTELSVHAISADGTTARLGELPGTFQAAAPGDDAGTLLLQVASARGVDTWRAHGGEDLLEPVVGAQNALEPFTLSPLPDGALIPWVDELGFARIGELGADGSVEPSPALDLPGNAGSDFHFVGELGGRAIFYAATAEHGPAVWTSDGTAAGTQPLLPSRCDPAGAVRPRLDLPDLVVDCVDDDGRTTVWHLDPNAGPVATELLFAGVHPSSSLSRFVRLGDRLVYLDPTRGVVATEIGTSSTVDLLVCHAAPAATATRAVVRCASELWSTDGTVAGTTRIGTVAISSAPLLEAGGKVLGTGAEAFLTDGTAGGTIPIAPLVGAAAAAVEMSATCTWDNRGVSVLNLGTGVAARLLDLPLYRVSEAEKAPGARRELLWLRTGPFADATPWLCDPARATIHKVPGYGGRQSSDFGWAASIHDDHALWRHVVTAAGESIERLDFARGGWSTVFTQPRPLNDHTIHTPSPGIAGNALWVALADEAHGREPWVVPLRVTVAAGSVSPGP